MLKIHRIELHIPDGMQLDAATAARVLARKLGELHQSGRLRTDLAAGVTLHASRLSGESLPALLSRAATAQLARGDRG